MISACAPATWPQPIRTDAQRLADSALLSQFTGATPKERRPIFDKLRKRGRADLLAQLANAPDTSPTDSAKYWLASANVHLAASRTVEAAHASRAAINAVRTLDTDGQDSVKGQAGVTLALAGEDEAAAALAAELTGRLRDTLGERDATVMAILAALGRVEEADAIVARAPKREGDMMAAMVANLLATRDVAAGVQRIANLLPPDLKTAAKLQVATFLVGVGHVADAMQLLDGRWTTLAGPILRALTRRLADAGRLRDALTMAGHAGDMHRSDLRVIIARAALWFGAADVALEAVDLAQTDLAPDLKKDGWELRRKLIDLRVRAGDADGARALVDEANAATASRDLASAGWGLLRVGQTKAAQKLIEQVTADATELADDNGRLGRHAGRGRLMGAITFLAAAGDKVASARLLAVWRRYARSDEARGLKQHAEAAARGGDAESALKLALETGPTHVAVGLARGGALEAALLATLALSKPAERLDALWQIALELPPDAILTDGARSAAARLLTGPDPRAAEPDPPSGVRWVRLDAGRFLVRRGRRVGRTEIWIQRLKAFDVGVAEVTVAQYRACVDAGKCPEPRPVNEQLAEFCNAGVDGRAQHPQNCVGYEESEAFCAWAGGRLPSESEWKFAASSMGRPADYPWGDDPATCQRANFARGVERRMSHPEQRALIGCKTGATRPVCELAAGHTAQGLCDMLGNVSELVAHSGQHLTIQMGGSFLSVGVGIVGDRQLQRRPHPETGFRCARDVAPGESQ